MNTEILPATPGDSKAAIEPEGWRRWLRDGENLLVSLTLAVLVLIPLAEIVLRKLFRNGISGAGAFEQHLTLVIGLLGGALAARESRLLTLSTLTNFLKGKWLAFSRIFSSSCAAGISLFLGIAAAQLVQSEREAGKILAYGIP
jgi:C4-dicarboxylate transporter, DctM subunit